MKYRVFIKLSDQSDIRVDILADSEESAIKKAISNESVAAAIEQSGQSVTDIEAVALGNRFEYRQKRDQDTHKMSYRVTDNLYGTVIEFEHGDFNGTSRCLRAPECTDPNASATAMREISDYVATYHRRDCFPGESHSDCIARLLSNAINRVGVTLKDLSERSGIPEQKIYGVLKHNATLRSIDLLQLCEALGAELRIVFPEDE